MTVFTYNGTWENKPENLFTQSLAVERTIFPFPHIKDMEQWRRFVEAKMIREGRKAK